MVNMREFTDRGRGNAVDYYNRHPSETARHTAEEQETLIERSTRAYVTATCTDFIYWHYNSESTDLYVYGYFPYGDREPYWYKVYGVDTDIAAIFLNPFHSMINVEKLDSVGESWDSQDEAVRWAPSISRTFIRREYNEHIYSAMDTNFQVLDLGIHAKDASTNKQKKVLLDRGDF